MSQFPDNSFDAVIETLVLCSVSDVSKSLKEIHRILKPSGKFYFFDHIIAPSDEKLLRSIQYLLTKTVSYSMHSISYQKYIITIYLGLGGEVRLLQKGATS